MKNGLLRFNAGTAILILNFFIISPGLRAAQLYPALTKIQSDSVINVIKKNKADTSQVHRLLQLSEYFLYKYVAIEADLDSAENYLKQAVLISDKTGFLHGQIRSGLVYGYLFLEKEDAVKAESYFQKALVQSKIAGYQLLEAESLYFLGDLDARDEEKSEKQLRYYAQAKNSFAKIGNRERIADVLISIGEVHYLLGNFGLCEKQLLEALKIYKSIGYKKLHITYNFLAMVYRNTGDYKEAVRLSLSAVDNAKATADTAGIGYWYARLGALYLDLNQLDEGLEYHQKALWNFQQERKIAFVLNMTRSIMGILMRQNKPDAALAFFNKIIKHYPPDTKMSENQVSSMLFDYYSHVKSYAAAERYLQKMIDYEEIKKNADIYKIATYHIAGRFYSTTKNYPKARFYLEKAMGWNNQIGSLQSESSLHLSLFKVDSAQGKYQSAIAHFQQHKTINDSIFNEKKSKQIANIQIQYNTRKKEQDIVLLTKQNQIQQTLIREREFQRNAIIGGAVMLLIVLVMIYNQYLTKQKSNVQLHEKQKVIEDKNESLQHLLLEKEWLLKEIHHRVKNNLQTVMSLLESQSAYLRNDALAAVKDSQHRIQAMSLIHQKLYLTENVTTIFMPAYVQEMIGYLRDSFTTGQRIRFESDMDPISLDIAQAIPLGLILNEAITNAIKYAFPGELDGKVVVTLKEHSENRFMLRINDNGIGLPDGFEENRVNSLGVKLMRGLSKEINGQFSMENDDGTVVNLLFSIEPVFQAKLTDPAAAKLELQQ